MKIKRCYDKHGDSITYSEFTILNDEEKYIFIFRCDTFFDYKIFYHNYLYYYDFNDFNINIDNVQTNDNVKLIHKNIINTFIHGFGL